MSRDTVKLGRRKESFQDTCEPLVFLQMSKVKEVMIGTEMFRVDLIPEVALRGASLSSVEFWDIVNLANCNEIITRHGGVKFHMPKSTIRGLDIFERLNGTLMDRNLYSQMFKLCEPERKNLKSKMFEINISCSNESNPEFMDVAKVWGDMPHIKENDVFNIMEKLTELGTTTYFSNLNKNIYKSNDKGWALDKINNPLKHIATSPGLSIPQIYFGTPGTVFCIHTEDFEFCSIHTNHSGAVKLWVIIPSHHFDKVRKLIAELGNTSCYNSVCSKSHFIPISTLRENQIDFSICLQNPEEIIVVFSKVHHEGINFGLNFTSSVNFVARDYLHTLERMGMVKDNKVIQPNKQLICKHQGHREFDKEFLTEIIERWTTLVQQCDRDVEESRHHFKKRKKEAQQFPCENCTTTFTRKSSLKRHKEQVHSEGFQYLCITCNNTYSRKGYLSIHKCVGR